MPTDTRDRRVVATVPCPKCEAPAGQPCRNPVLQFLPDWARATAKHPARPHQERRRAWVQQKFRAYTRDRGADPTA